MKRPTIKKMLRGSILATAVFSFVLSMVMFVFWGTISEAYGPMEQDELQCLICHRERVKKWVCGSKIRDDVVTNEYSEWIDGFTPSTHQHVWMPHTHHNRSHWFGSTSIACSGIATIPRIFEQRNSLGELESRQLASKFHKLVEPPFDFTELEQFTRTVVEDPGSLLQSDN